MKKETKSGSLLRGLRKKIIKRKSSSNSKENYQSNVKNVGSKEVESEHLSNILLYDSCYKLPMNLYIDMVVDDNLNVLAIKGNPTIKELEEAQFKIISEFSELSNDGESQAMSEVINNFYYQRNLIVGYELSLKLVIAGKFEKSIEYLNDNGLKCLAPETEEEYQKLIHAIRMRIKNRIVKYKEAQNQYKALSSGKGEKPTRKYFNKLLIMLSTCEAIKLQLNFNKLTAAEFSTYLNMFNEYQNHLKMRKNQHG